MGDITGVNGGMNMVEHSVPEMVSISEFSQGKASKIIMKVSQEDKPCIIIKNNQPTAVLSSIKEYDEMQKKMSQLYRLIGYYGGYAEYLAGQENNKTCSFKDYLFETQQKEVVDEVLQVADEASLLNQYKHKTFQERLDEYDGAFHPLRELDWGESVGRELW